MSRAQQLETHIIRGTWQKKQLMRRQYKLNMVRYNLFSLTILLFFAEKAKKGMSQTDLLQKQQREARRHQKELLRNIWIASEKGDYRACHDILVS